MNSGVQLTVLLVTLNVYCCIIPPHFETSVYLECGIPFESASDIPIDKHHSRTF